LHILQEFPELSVNPLLILVLLKDSEELFEPAKDLEHLEPGHQQLLDEFLQDYQAVSGFPVSRAVRNHSF